MNDLDVLKQNIEAKLERLESEQKAMIISISNSTTSGRALDSWKKDTEQQQAQQPQALRPQVQPLQAKAAPADSGTSRDVLMHAQPSAPSGQDANPRTLAGGRLRVRELPCDP